MNRQSNTDLALNQPNPIIGHGEQGKWIEACLIKYWIRLTGLPDDVWSVKSDYRLIRIDVNSYLFTGYRGYTPFVSVNNCCAALNKEGKQ